MKKIFVLISVFFLLTACTPDEEPAENTGNMSDVTSEAVTEMASVGETCGGAAAKLCKPGLECVFDFDKADARGRCADSVVDKDVECPLVKNPVCGQKGLQKNGYLNECEAERHGAEILHTGFCKIDPEVEGDCEAQAMGIGTCFKVTRGWEYNKKADTCVQKNIGGCEAEIPFRTRDLCLEACVN